MYTDLSSNTRANVNTLLKKNSSTFRLLHFYCGYDFEKPFEIINGKGKFTARTIEQLIKKYIHDYCSDTYSCFMIITETSPYRKESIHGCLYNYIRGFIQLKGSLNKTGREYVSHGIDNYYSIKDFENTRKNCVDEYFIVIQQNDFILTRLKAVEFDFTERIDRIEDYNDIVQGNYKSYFKNGGKASEDFDKSGYYLITNRNNYAARVKALKAEREKARADTIELSVDIERFEKEIMAIRKYIADTIINVGAVKLGKYETAIRYLKYSIDYLGCFKDNYNEKKFSSVDSIKRSIKMIEDDIKMSWEYLK